MERRLAAILAADVVGYSRLMGEDEEATLATLDWDHGREPWRPDVHVVSIASLDRAVGAEWSAEFPRENVFERICNAAESHILPDVS